MACRCATVPPASIAFFFFNPLSLSSLPSPLLSPPLPALRSQVNPLPSPALHAPIYVFFSTLPFSLGRPRLALVTPDRRVPVPPRQGGEGRVSVSLLARIPARSAPSSRPPLSTPPRPSSRSLFPASSRRARRDRPP